MDGGDLAHAHHALAGLSGEPAVRALWAAARGVPTHLVGGLLRDRLRGVPTRDYDAVVEREGERISTRVARALGARRIPLGSERHPAFRVAGRDFTLDLWDRRGAPLTSDLARRDFTVNALALDLDSGQLHDPHGALEDLAARRLRAVTRRAFREDPVRVVRLVRLLAQLRPFSAEPATVALARGAAERIPSQPAERVRQELARAFHLPLAGEAARCLVDTGLAGILVPGLPGEDVPGRLERLRRAIALVPSDLVVDLEAAQHAILLAGAPDGEACKATTRLARRGYLSKAVAARVLLLLACRAAPTTDVERRRFLHRAGDLWPTAAALLAAQGEAGEATALERVARSDAATVKPPRLVRGDEAARLLGLAPGRELGEALAALRQAQVDGEVRDREAALAFLRRLAAPAPTSR